MTAPTATTNMIAMFVGADGRDYWADIDAEPSGNGYVRLTFTAAAMSVAGMRLATIDLDPATVRLLHAATAPKE